jgi:hypothetical protein
MATLVPETFGWALVTGIAHPAARERKRAISTTAAQARDVISNSFSIRFAPSEAASR